MNNVTHIESLLAARLVNELPTEQEREQALMLLAGLVKAANKRDRHRRPVGRTVELA